MRTVARLQSSCWRTVGADSSYQDHKPSSEVQPCTAAPLGAVPAYSWRTGVHDGV